MDVAIAKLKSRMLNVGRRLLAGCIVIFDRLEPDLRISGSKAPLNPLERHDLSLNRLPLYIIGGA
jgi:hypothetical protein